MDLPKNNQRLNEQDELRRLREENARLKVLLTRHGIAREEPAVSEPVPAPAPTLFTTDGKIALFRRLFRGREDVYPQRWESAKGTSGYAPTCGNTEPPPTTSTVSPSTSRIRGKNGGRPRPNIH